MKLSTFRKTIEREVQISLVINPSDELLKYRDRIPDFFNEVLGIVLTEDQAKIANSIKHNRQTNCQSAHAQGKTLFAAGLMLYWVFVHRGLGISTAPTARQTKELLWSELRRLYDAKRSIFGGERGQLFVKLNEVARGFGFTAAQHSGTGSGSQAFQGIHSSAGVLVVIDEAGGVSEEIINGAEACTTAHGDRMLLIGNPLAIGTPFYKACQRSHVKIPAFNHVNVSWAYRQCADGIHRLRPEVADRILNSKGEVLSQSDWHEDLPRDRIPGAISIQWIEDIRSKHSERSPFWLSRVLAEFPADDIDGIIPLTFLHAARRLYDSDPTHWDNTAQYKYWRLGADIGDGGDNHSIAAWKGNVLYSVDIHPTLGDGEDVTRAAGLITRALKLRGLARAAVDKTGVGAGALAVCKEGGYPVVGCNFGGKAHDSEQFENRKIELFWDLREGLRTGKYAIAPLGEKEDYIFADLSATRYKVLSNGKLCCEPKEETRKRLKRSPDSESAVIALEISETVTPMPPSPHGSERLWTETSLSEETSKVTSLFN